jgi:Reverse transcriptase (RNA-dependent DNA polymerase)
MNVKNASLQSTLEEEVYMTLPSIYENNSNKDFMCKLNKSTYDLKQSPQVWYDKLNHSLLLYNFTKSLADSFMFVKYSNDIITVVLVYVDDIIVTRNNEK